jgi:N-acetylmuramoyl-L-alanine amidase
MTLRRGRRIETPHGTDSSRTVPLGLLPARRSPRCDAPADGHATPQRQRGRPPCRGRARRRAVGPSRGVVRGLLAALVGAVAAASLLLSARIVGEPLGPGGQPAAAVTALPPPITVDPLAFASAGCIALPARISPPRAVVMLDAGHGGPDPGSLGITADGRRIAEKELTLLTTLAVASRLRDRGVTVVLSRSTDDLGGPIEPGDVQNGSLTTAASQRDLLGRVRCANLARVDALVSVHFNSFDDPAVSGTETLYDVDRPLAPRSRALARSLQTNIRAGLAALGRTSPDRGIIDDASGGEASGGHLVLLGPRIPGYVDEPSAMPGALVEPFFMTNPGDLSAVASPGGVGVLAGGVEEYLDGTRRR